MKTFKTKAGTELPLLNLKGKDYLQAQHRVQWFREEKPDWGIETEIVSHSQDHTVSRCTIRDDKGRIMAQASKEETRQGFPDHLEKSETGSISRALALCGYGTQFAQEFEEGERLADSPSPPKAPQSAQAASSPPPPGVYLIPFGKFKGKSLTEVDPKDLESYANWVASEADKKGKKLEGPAAELVERIFDYITPVDASGLN